MSEATLKESLGFSMPNLAMLSQFNLGVFRQVIGRPLIGCTFGSQTWTLLRNVVSCP